jgi:hypothetical protein
MRVYEKPNVTMDHDTTKSILNVKWLGYAKSEIFRSGIDFMVGFVKENGVRNLVVDATDQSVLSKEDNEYAMNTMPLLKSYGLEKMAFIIPKSVLTKLAMDRFIKGSSTQVALGHFSSLEEALAWTEVD